MRQTNAYHLLQFTFKWLLIACVVGALAGSASALFLASLEYVTNYRESHTWLYFCLPLFGLLVALLYYYFGKSVEKGNNQIIDEIIEPQEIISWRMAPMVLIGTLLTHLGGGSAGREGTAVQMSDALADQLSRLLKFDAQDRKILLICGVSAGFASIFGTPIAGTVFALEVYIIGKLSYEALVPALFAAIAGHLVSESWGVEHTPYSVLSDSQLNLQNLLLALLSGVAFAAAGWIFNRLIPLLKSLFLKIPYPLLRPVLGGVIVIVLLFLLGDFRIAGLGIPTIVDSFDTPQPAHLFLTKILLTAITLAAGFKGGEVTPLFFIGATLGSFISTLIPLPTDLLAAMGFVAVFAAAANTPLACVLMGVELFGSQHIVFIAIACLISYLFSGHTGIYSSQLIGSSKHHFLKKHSGRKLKDL